MILGVDKILNLVKEKKLVENLCERELTNPEGAGVDLRIGELYEIKGGGYLGVEERKTSDLELVAKYKDKEIVTIELKPRTTYIMKTIEKVNTPNDILILFRTRTNLFRSGVKLVTGACAPGYCGELTFGIENSCDHAFKLEMGARVAHAMFYKVEGETHLYRGQWQGGRVSTDKKEVQV